MRWILLLLLLLNAFYYVWHQQQAPLRAKEVAPAGAYQAARKDIRLLSEADAPRSRGDSPAAADAAAPEAAVCLYLGSFEEEARARVVATAASSSTSLGTTTGSIPELRRVIKRAGEVEAR